MSYVADFEPGWGVTEGIGGLLQCSSLGSVSVHDGEMGP